MAEEIKEQQAWVLTNNDYFMVNGKSLMDRGANEFTKETFDQKITAHEEAGKCVESIHIETCKFDSNAWNQMWSTFIPRITDTGLTGLRLMDLSGGVTGDDIMPELVGSPISTLLEFDLEKNASWCESGEAFTQLLVFLGR